MIDPSQTLYYLTYGVVSIVLLIVYLKLKSTESSVIVTTKEFQTFQSSFISGFSLVILCEFVAAASFYHTLITMHLELEQITRLYLVTVIASTIFSILLEIVDLGTRKDKCVLSALLYSVSMFSMLFGGHYEMLLLSRILYGFAAALQQTSFELYAVHQHSSQGYPEDWLTQSFTWLTHLMSLMAVLSGILGQSSASLGHLGCVSFCCVGFALAALYLFVTWEKDINSPRFMLSGFLFNANQV
jgi:MFS family permease